MRHSGRRLGIAAFAARAGVATSTLEAYKSRGQPRANPVPPPCWPRGDGGNQQWCEAHVDEWISKRPGYPEDLGLEN